MSSPGSQNRPAEDRQKGAVLGACPWPHWWAGSGRDLAEIPGCASLGVGWSCDELAPTQSCPLVPTTVMTSVPLNQSPGLTPWPSLAAPQSGTEVPAPLWRVEYSLGAQPFSPSSLKVGGPCKGAGLGWGTPVALGRGPMNDHARSAPPTAAGPRPLLVLPLGVTHPRSCSRASGGWLQAQARPGCL